MWPSPPTTSERESRGALIEFRIVHLEPHEGRTAAEFEGRWLYLDPTVALSDPDFTYVRPRVDGDAVVLDLDMTPAAAARVRQITGDNIGRRMAMLFDSRVVSAPVINAAIGGHAVARLPTPDAEAVAQRIRGRWPQR